MKINLEQAAQILGKSSHEVLYIVQDQRLFAKIKKDDDMIFNDDGTVSFVKTANTSVDWEFDLNEVLQFKRDLDAGLDGTLKRILLSE